MTSFQPTTDTDTQRSDEQELKALFQRLCQAWTDGDAAAYGACFTADCDYVSFDGTRTHGREDVVESHDKLFAECCSVRPSSVKSSPFATSPMMLQCCMATAQSWLHGGPACRSGGERVTRWLSCEALKAGGLQPSTTGAFDLYASRNRTPSQHGSPTHWSPPRAQPGWVGHERVFGQPKAAKTDGRSSAPAPHSPSGDHHHLRGGCECSGCRKHHLVCRPHWIDGVGRGRWAACGTAGVVDHRATAARRLWTAHGVRSRGILQSDLALSRHRRCAP